MKRWLELIHVYWRVGIMNEMQYRVNFFVQLFQSLIALVTGLVALSLVFTYTDSLGGWGKADLLAIMGVHILVGGIIKVIIQPNMQRLMQDVEQGTLDYTLTKPEDSQLLVSIREFKTWQLIDVIIGIIVLAVALWQLQSAVSPFHAFAFLLSLLLGSLILYAIWLILSTFVFWFIRIGNMIELFQSLYQAGRWPVSVYPGWLRSTLTFIVPVAFAVTVPAEALTGRLTLSSLGTALLLTIFFLWAARRFWFIGLRNYSGASA